MKNTIAEQRLIETLMHNAVASGNKVLERRLADLTVWFYKNKDRIPRDNLASRHALLEKAFWTMLEVNALLLERILDMENRKGGSPLWLPKGMNIEGEMRVE